jgi:S-DNA-T family DNA segregation ATPase FtsK/SpoIIIE
LAPPRKNKLREPEETPEVPARRKRTRSAKDEIPGGRLQKLRAFWGDERVHKVSGLFLVLLAAYLVVAFTSYLVTWRADQDLMGRPWGELFSPSVQVENWLGKLGALIGHRFIFIWFGVAAFSFVLWSFLCGIRLALGTWLLPVGRTLRWSLMAMLWLPTLFGFFFATGGGQVLGGGIGHAINGHLRAWLGTFGAGTLILFSAAAFLVYTFNPSLSWLAELFKRKPREQAVEEGTGEDAEEERFNKVKEVPVAEVSLAAMEAEEEEEATAEAVEEGEEDVAMQDPEEPEAAAAVEMSPTVPTLDLSGIHEEANGFSVEAAVQEEALTEAQIETKLKEFGEYDPTLDLSSYELPPIDLLVDHGTGELTVTKEELEANKNRIVETLSHYNIGIDKIKATIGPTVTLYEIIPQAGCASARSRTWRTTSR